MQVDCALYLANCTHDTLFQPSYVRCQKSQGQKILRCFPHCCPRHIHYRNCGCSVNLRVHTAPRNLSNGSGPATANAGYANAAATGARPSVLVAYAKFSQLDEDVDWAVHDIVPAGTVLDDLRSRDSPFRTWIPGHVEWTKGNTWSFQFDEKKGDGWHYGWKSGRSRSQRTSAHVLKAFVFDVSNDGTWCVVGIASSTPFTITSYRGEHNRKQKKKELSACAASSSYMHKFRRATASPSSLSIVRWSEMSSDDNDDYNVAGIMDDSARVIRPRNVSSSTGSITASAVTSTRIPTHHKTTRSGAPTSMPILATYPTMPEHGDIANLFAVLHVLEPNDCPPSLWTSFESSWMESKGFSTCGRSLLPLFYHSHHRQLRHHLPFGGSLSPLHDTALGLCLHLISSLRNVSDRIQRTLVSHGEAVLDKQQALRVYDDCMGILQRQVQAVLTQHEGGPTDIKELLRYLPQIPTSHMSPSNHLYRLFVAQLREMFIASQNDHVSTQSVGTTAFDGMWVHMPECTFFSTWTLSLSLMGYLRWTSNLVAFSQTRSGHSIQIRSATPWFASVPMLLELDQIPHSLRVLPSGESCLAGTLAIDYMGQATDNFIRLELYVFGLTTVHVVFLEATPQVLDTLCTTIWMECQVRIDEVRRDGEVGLGDESSMDAANRIAWVQQLAHRTTVVQMVAKYERTAC
ncbi:hypothetical protein H310_04765 [Aphanomyces invadans]|uniref:Uncharacterized protein n=1 Tax=Aphanomyces invadans TaxID=157072 RepID=A0A024UDN6_9STRA|nr:hypothetical protein H310_04765 [Aphanomyces invadans]ETW04511.1 hypothetical protein H310_04765 [Aphanomyces invadans]|eukprot:XP_008867467.1 hypothetical protein H310_04765 [Aphanomyces invadans]